jgi:hypothetical protein
MLASCWRTISRSWHMLPLFVGASHARGETLFALDFPMIQAKLL